MSKITSRLSYQTRLRYGLVVMLLLSGLAIIFSSFYFLYFPVGFQGGKNPFYGTVILFDRVTWDLIHLWSGIVMILVILIHIPIHWKWIIVMTQRCFGNKRCRIGRLNWKAKWNIFLDGFAALSFIWASISGIYLLFNPKNSFASLPISLFFPYQTWDVIHTWSGAFMIIAVLLHVLLHWGWIVNISSKWMKPNAPKPQEKKFIEELEHV